MIKKTEPALKTKRAPTFFLPWLLITGGALGLLASLALAIEKFDMLQTSSYTAVCDLNPILSCSTVADSPQAEVFGFPNPLLGIAGYAIVATIGTTLLAGARLARWFWRLTEAGLLFAFAFITWLQYQSLYEIGALCLYCMVVWAVTGPLLWYVTLYNLRTGHIRVPAPLNRATMFAQRHHGDILLAWFVLITVLILKRFWYYWSTLL